MTCRVSREDGSRVPSHRERRVTVGRPRRARRDAPRAQRGHLGPRRGRRRRRARARLRRRPLIRAPRQPPRSGGYSLCGGQAAKQPSSQAAKQPSSQPPHMYPDDPPILTRQALLLAASFEVFVVAPNSERTSSSGASTVPSFLRSRRHCSRERILTCHILLRRFASRPTSSEAEATARPRGAPPVGSPRGWIPTAARGATRATRRAPTPPAGCSASGASSRARDRASALTVTSSWPRAVCVCVCVVV